MCRSLRIAGLAVLLMLLSACNIRTNNATNTPYPTLDIPRVTILFPENLSTIVEGTDLGVQVLAEDSGPGVARVELLVDDLPADNVTPEVSAAVPVFNAIVHWTAEGVGKHSISVTAYRTDGVSSAPTVIIVEVLKRS